MYIYAFTGARFDDDINLNGFVDPIGNAMRARLKKSTVVKERIKKYISRTTERNPEYSKTEGIDLDSIVKNAADRDLKYSVGHAENCKISVERKGKTLIQKKENTKLLFLYPIHMILIILEMKFKMVLKNLLIITLVINLSNLEH